MTENPNGNWLKLYRCLQDDETWMEMPYSIGKLWMFLLMEATYPGRRGRDHLQPGQLDHSIRFICEALSWIDRQKHKQRTPSKPTIQKDLERLKDQGKIIIEATPGLKTVISICKWEAYQGNEEGAKDSDKDSDKDKPKKVKKKRVKKESKKKESPHDAWIDQTIEDFYKLPHTMDRPDEEGIVGAYNMLVNLIDQNGVEKIDAAIQYGTTDEWWVETRNFRSLRKLVSKRKEDGEPYWSFFYSKSEKNGQHIASAQITADPETQLWLEQQAQQKGINP